MAIITNAVKGTNDMLPLGSSKWQYVEKVTSDIARIYGYKEIRTPTFEHTELFVRSVGDTTDVVQKEMYTFDDKGGRSITLRPEGTAGTVRAVLEHGLLNDALPLKVFYIGPCFRYEKPQSGRFREHHQFGVECFGAGQPAADAEIMLLAAAVFRRLGITELSLEINSIGCPECRNKYTSELKKFFGQQKDKLCGTCLSRLDRNPMRILDCKSPVCSELAANAPVITDYICGECSDHFEKVKSCLENAGLRYTVNPKIVRGLDYYTRTVFEFISTQIGSKGSVCSGGRYDGLTEALGGQSAPALGFGMGLERLLMVMDAQGCEFPPVSGAELYIAPLGEKAAAHAVRLCEMIRAEGFSAITDLTGRSLKAQMKYADKIGAQNTLVIGDDEIEKGEAMMKDMETGEQVKVALNEELVSAVYDRNIKRAFGELEETLEKFE